jgi:hypothetical protein
MGSCAPAIVCVALTLFARLAASDPRVVIVETQDGPALPALATQVQTYAGRSIAVSTVRDDGTSSTFASRASRVVEERDATVVVWVAVVAADVGGDRTFLVYAAGRWPGRALIELVRIDGRTEPGDVERTIALKIAALLDAVTAVRPMGAALGVPTNHTRWRADVAGSIVHEAGDRDWDGRLSMGVDRRSRFGDWSLAIGIGSHWQPSSTIEGERGYVSLDEVGLELNIAAERTFGSWTLFGRPHVSGSLLIARGTSVDGPTGSATLFSPSAGVDVGARWSVSDTIQLVVACTLDVAWFQQRLLVDGVVTADLQYARFGLALGLSIPLR